LPTNSRQDRSAQARPPAGERPAKNAKNAPICGPGRVNPMGLGLILVPAATGPAVTFVVVHPVSGTPVIDLKPDGPVARRAPAAAGSTPSTSPTAGTPGQGGTSPEPRGMNRVLR
jgi:tRNA (Thr-GGU) A37 N-methylase